MELGRGLTPVAPDRAHADPAEGKAPVAVSVGVTAD